MAVRIMSAEVKYILTEFNERGEPINEYISQPLRCFRAVHQDIWAHGEAQAFPKAPAVASADDSTPA